MSESRRLGDGGNIPSGGMSQSGQQLGSPFNDALQYLDVNRSPPENLEGYDLKQKVDSILEGAELDPLMETIINQYYQDRFQMNYYYKTSYDTLYENIVWTSASEAETNRLIRDNEDMLSIDEKEELDLSYWNKWSRKSNLLTTDEALTSAFVRRNKDYQEYLLLRATDEGMSQDKLDQYNQFYYNQWDDVLPSVYGSSEEFRNQYTLTSEDNQLLGSDEFNDWVESQGYNLDDVFDNYHRKELIGEYKSYQTLYSDDTYNSQQYSDWWSLYSEGRIDADSLSREDRLKLYGGSPYSHFSADTYKSGSNIYLFEDNGEYFTYNKNSSEPVPVPDYLKEYLDYNLGLPQGYILADEEVIKKAGSNDLWNDSGQYQPRPPRPSDTWVDPVPPAETPATPAPQPDPEVVPVGASGTENIFSKGFYEREDILEENFVGIESFNNKINLYEHMDQWWVYYPVYSNFIPISVGAVAEGDENTDMFNFYGTEDTQNRWNTHTDPAYLPESRGRPPDEQPEQIEEPQEGEEEDPEEGGELIPAGSRDRPDRSGGGDDDEPELPIDEPELPIDQPELPIDEPEPEEPSTQPATDPIQNPYSRIPHHPDDIPHINMAYHTQGTEQNVIYFDSSDIVWGYGIKEKEKTPFKIIGVIN